MKSPKLFLIHCGYYDRELLDGVYEQHVNLFVVADTFEEAKEKVKLDPRYKKHKMHVDGMQLIELVDGHRVTLEAEPALAGQTQITGSRYRSFGWHNKAQNLKPKSA